jgi:hypothetical protein
MMRYFTYLHLFTDSEVLLQTDQENSGFLDFISVFRVLSYQ